MGELELGPDQFSKRHQVVVRLCVEVENQQEIELWSTVPDRRGPWFEDVVEQARMLVGGLEQMMSFRDEERRRAEPDIVAESITWPTGKDVLARLDASEQRGHVWAGPSEAIKRCQECGVLATSPEAVEDCRGSWTKQRGMEHSWEGPWEPDGPRRCTRCGKSDRSPDGARPCRGYWTEHDVLGTSCRRCGTDVPHLLDQCVPVLSYRISAR